MTIVGRPVLPPHTAFTSRYNGRSLRLTTEVEIFEAFVPPAPPGAKGGKYTALYDTGATHSAISPKVVADLQLSSVGARNVGVGGGTLATTTHIVNIGLPNKVLFGMTQVSQMVLPGGVDVLIGMDILGMGDFAVTHQDDKTTFSFCFPSRREIDFATELEEQQKAQQARSTKVGRNDPCPCGSGNKYKKCHGR